MSSASPSDGPVVAITMGDPAGIGPEICCAASADPGVLAVCRPVVFGSQEVLERVARELDRPLPAAIVDVGPDGWRADQAPLGRASAAGGALAGSAIEAAVQACLDGDAAAIVTAPISKTAIQAAGVPFPGHTEWIAARCGIAYPVMMLHDPALTVALVTVHRSIASVPAALDTASIVRTGELLGGALRRLGIAHPKLAVLGLNPHAGEGGMFGDEDERLVAPAVDALREAGVDATGPLPPDTAFTAEGRERYDGHVCLYHDQGLIPFKALAFDHGVNVTLGLPIVRTSVDHGTAFDIAGRGLASATSLISAIRLAVRLAS